MKQIIVATNVREKYQKYFPEKEFYVNWCDVSTDALLKIRDRSNIIFLCMEGIDKDELLKVALYLRDACIEDEKHLYVYGNLEDVNRIKAHVPAMYISKSEYTINGFKEIVLEIIRTEVNDQADKPGILIIDNDVSYIESLRINLEEYFRVYVSHYDFDEIELMIKETNISLVGTDGVLVLSEAVRLLILLNDMKDAPDYHYYFVAPTNNERNSLNSESDKIGISLSKEMDLHKLTHFLISKASTPSV